MTLGTGIFLSTLIVSVLALYGMTKERWMWKKIVVRTVLTLILLIATISGGIHGLKLYQNRATPQTEISGIKLSNTKSDIRFIKGAPDIEKDNIWAYREGIDNEYKLLVTFHEDTIRAVIYVGDCSYCNEISGLGIGDSYEEVIEKFGDPSNLSVSQDKLERLASFEKYNVFFTFRENQIFEFGIFNKEYGDFKFKEDSLDAKTS